MTNEGWGEDWRRARRILAVRLDAAGDVVMTTPALRGLTEGGAEVTLLTSPAGASMARLVPDLRDVIVYEAPWMKHSEPAPASTHLRFIEEIASREFDAAVIFTVYSQSPLPAAHLCLLAGIPLRLACCRENPYELLTHWVPETEPHEQVRHEVQRQVDLVALVGLGPSDMHLRLHVPDDARQRMAALLTREGLAEHPWAVMHVGASAPSRRYPAERFAEAARTLVQRHGWRLLLTGTEAERDLVESVRQQAGGGARSMVGRLDLPDLAALLEAAPLLISNNTAPVHIAAAAGTPVVDLYALTNPQHTPWMTPSRVLSRDVPCRNCYRSICPLGHQACLDVPADEVVAAALDLAAGADVMARRSRPWGAPSVPGSPSRAAG